MSDFYLDFREKSRRKTSRAASLLQYYSKINVTIFKNKEFDLVVSRPDDMSLWGPFKSPDEKILVALSGRIATEGYEWEKVKKQDVNGGIACKIIYNMYKEEGIKSLEKLNGNYVVFVCDNIQRKFYIIIDRCGMFSCFSPHPVNDELVFSSHPDVLATALGMSDDWELTSMAEFLITGKVSFPYSYYKKIRALDYGCSHTIDLREGQGVYTSKNKYFSFNYNVDTRLSEWNLAEELASSFKKAVNKRTLPIFGQTAVSLSGGLDSRTILCAADNKDDIWTFCFFDEENFEYRTAEAIAKGTGVKFIPMKRDFDYYGNSSEMGIRISGGMGMINSNHYLGFRSAINDCGIDNIITGCYCDYFFKGLALNTKENRFLRYNRSSKFQYEYYDEFFWFNTVSAKEVKNRLDNTYSELGKDQSDTGKLRIEEKRLFPLYYESDNAQRIIPQRVFQWYLPIVDNDIIDIYLKIPPKYKINASVFSKIVQIICGEEVCTIPNSNTGIGINASYMDLLIHQYTKFITEKLKRKITHNISAQGSWPNWQSYVHSSNKIKSLWMRKNKIAEDILRQIMGEYPYPMTMQDCKGTEMVLFFRLLTLKLWLDQRTR